MLQAEAINEMAGSQLKQDRIYTLVVGMGVTGLSVVSYLHALGETLIVVDSREVPPRLQQLKEQYPEIEVHTGEFKPELFNAAHRIVLSPGVPLSTPVVRQARELGVEITGDIDLFAHEVAAPVVGITGSNGKSTVTSLLSYMAERAGMNVGMGGNMGTPALDLLDDKTELYVLELSSFQLETLASLPMQAAVVLNISPDHMDRYPDLNSYAASKMVIYDNADKLVVNRDDALVNSLLPVNRQVIGFTVNPPEGDDFGVRHYADGDWICRGTQKLIAVESLKIKGQHNVANAMAALALGSLINLPLPAMLNALSDYSGLEHRTQWVAESNGVRWFNDSKGTNIGASIAAIQGLPGKHVLIAGGDGKQADFRPLRELAEKHLRAAVLIGRDAALIEAALDNVVPVFHAKDMVEAVAISAQAALPGDNVLLSPACASFDMYRNYEHRGEVFMHAVREFLS